MSKRKDIRAEKKKAKYVRMSLTKPSLKKMLTKGFLVTALVWALVCVILTAVIYGMYKNRVMDKGQEVSVNAINTIAEYLNNRYLISTNELTYNLNTIEKDNELKLGWFGNWFMKPNEDSMNSDNIYLKCVVDDEVIYDSDDRTYAVIVKKQHEGGLKYYTLDPEYRDIIRKYDESCHDGTYDKEYNVANNWDALYVWYYDGIYIKPNSDYYVPEKIYVYSVGFEQIIEDEIGYTYVSSHLLAPEDERLNLWSDVLIGPYPTFYKDIDAFKAGIDLCEKKIESDRTPWKNVYGDIEGFYDNHSSFGAVNAYAGLYDCNASLDKNQVFIYTVARYNFFDDCGKSLLTMYEFILVILMFLYSISTLITYNKRSVIYAVESNRRNMTNTMAHDLKSPLMIVSGYAENLKASWETLYDTCETLKTEAIENNASKDILHYVNEIQNTVSYMNSIIENSLGFAKLEAMQDKLNKEEVDFRVLLTEIFEKHKSSQGKRMSLSIAGNVKLKCDRNLITQAFDNIIGNALKYGIEDNVVEISLRAEGITISNTFDGKIDVSANDLKKSFIRGQKSRTDIKGTGLGLAIADNIFIKHNMLMMVLVETNKFKVTVTW